MVRRYIKNVLVGFDQFINTLLGGDPDETISSRLGKRARQGDRMSCLMCKLLHWLDRDHCEKAIEQDEGKRAIIP